MKRCCTSYDISEMQIKTTKASHHTSILLVKMWITDNTKYWQGCEAKVWMNSHSLLVGMKKDSHFGRQFGSFLKIYVHTKTCTWIFTAALFTTAKTWKQPRYPSVGKWINKLWYIQTKEYYSLLKRIEVPSYGKTWRNLKHILSKRWQSEKTYILYDSNYVAFWKRHSFGDSKKISGCSGGREGGMRGKWIPSFRGHRGFLWQWNDSVW